MKIERFDFYWSIVTALIAVIVAAAVAFFLSSCEPIEAILPDDWPIHVVDNDTIPQDSVVIDTLPNDTIIPIDVDTCESFTEHTTPEFVTLYVKFDTPQDSVLWEGGGIQSYLLSDVVTHITSLQSKTQVGDIGGNSIIKGTNNHQQFQLKVFARIDKAKWYMGTAKQGMILPGSDAAYFKENMQEYPSYNQITFWGVNCSCEEGVELTRFALEDCHAGRWYFDMFYLLCQPPQTVRDSLGLYGWEKIRAAAPNYVIDLRGRKDISEEYLRTLAETGKQIIVDEN